MSAEILSGFKSKLKEYSIGVLNIIPSTDWKSVKFVVKDGYTFNSKLLQALIKYCDNHKVQFYITSVHKKSIDVVLRMTEPAVTASLSTLDISSIAKVFKSNKQLSYTLTEENDEDVFLVFVKRDAVRYAQLKDLIKIYLKNKIDFHVTADDIGYLSFKYSKKDVEEF